MIRTRFAPSPTGNLHIGGLRTALYSWAYSKHFNGIFILRIEDTDKKRYVPGSIKNITNTLFKLGLFYDNIFYQSKRLIRYKEVIDYLLNNNYAYYNIENNNNKNKKYFSNNKVIKFRIKKEGYIIWNDLIKGKIKIYNKELNDFVLIRSNGMPTYNFCSVIDDIDMGITHIIRGDDHLSNTPKQIHIFKALCATLPIYAHLPMILDENGKKISKRTNPVNIINYLNLGYLPESILNYIARLGWGFKNKEIFSIKEFYSIFNINNISKSPSRLNNKKLNWINRYYIKNISFEKLKKLIPKYLIKKLNFNIIIKIFNLFKKNINTINDFLKYIEIFINNNFINKYYLNKDDIILNIIIRNFFLKCINIKWNYLIIQNLINFITNFNKLYSKKLYILFRKIFMNNLNTPSIINVIELFKKKHILKILKKLLTLKK